MDANSNYRFPFVPYPYSWYQVALSSDLAVGKLKIVNFFNREFVAYRNHSGTVTFADAYCPHLGAHLGINGKVEVDGLRCPFHGWKFDEHGDCIGIPYCDEIPRRAKLETYPVVEKNGVIFVFYGEQYNEIMKKLDEFPSDLIPEYPEFQDKSWSAPMTLQYKIPSHVQEMAENAIDMAHFPLIHQYYKMPEIEKIDETEHQFTIKFAGTRKIFNLKSLIDVELNAVGLGVVFGKTVTDYLKVRAIHAVTPINEHELLVVVTITYNKTWNIFRNLFYKLFLKREVHHFTSGDRIILGNKIYRKNPILCKNDGPIPKFRRWALKFY